MGSACRRPSSSVLSVLPESRIRVRITIRVMVMVMARVRVRNRVRFNSAMA